MKSIFNFLLQGVMGCSVLAFVACQSHQLSDCFSVTAKQVCEMTAADAKSYLHQHYAITEKDYDSSLCKVFENNNSAVDVALLLKAGANPDAIIKKDSGQTLAHVACQAAKANTAWGMEVLKLLKVHGADFNKTDNLGYTPLHHVVSNRYAEACLFLLETCKVNTEIKHHLDLTPLLWAACLGDRNDMIRMLINHGANVHATAYDGKVNILTYYEDRNEQEFCSYLKQLGVTPVDPSGR